MAGHKAPVKQIKIGGLIQLAGMLARVKGEDTKAQRDGEKRYFFQQNPLRESSFFPQIEDQQSERQGDGSWFGKAGEQKHGKREPIVFAKTWAFILCVF